MGKFFRIAALLLLLASCARDPYSVRMAQSEMSRFPEPAELDGMQGTLKWNYTTGLELLAILDVYEANGDTALLGYVDRWYDAIIGEDGRIGANYKISNYNLDHVCPARTLLKLSKYRPCEKYAGAVEEAMEQLSGQPRTLAGAFWHKKAYPYQVWLDGLYMAEPFYAEVAASKEGAERDSLFHDIALQFRVAADSTFDAATGLYRHAWNESRDMFWAEPETGRSAHAWGRAMGWYAMALVDVLDFFPENHPDREAVLGILQHVLEVLPEYADPETGMWYQVLDRPGAEGNYIESTCSAMFSYTYLKALRKGYIPAERAGYVKSVYEGLLKAFVAENADGTLSLTRCCAVAGLGGKTNRSGTFDYYIHEKIIDNDPKGIGPFIWASLEYERL